MVIPIPQREGRWASGNDLCPSIPEKVRSVAMAMPIPLFKRGHGLCPSIPEKGGSVVMAMLIPILEGRGERGHGLCLSPLEKRRSGGDDHPLPMLKRKVGNWP